MMLDITYASRYQWRGMPVNQDPVIQPCFEISGYGFQLNIWGNMDTTAWGENEGGYGDESWNLTEIDFTGTYEHSIGPVSLSGGFISYTFPNVDVSPTVEVFAGAAIDVPLYPSITSYWDEGLYWGANYTSLGLGHSFGLWERETASLGLDVFTSAGFANDEFFEAYYGLEDGEGWHDWSAGASVPLSLDYGFSITPGFFHSGLLHEDARDVVNDLWDRDTDSDVLTLSVGWSQKISGE